MSAYYPTPVGGDLVGFFQQGEGAHISRPCIRYQRRWKWGWTLLATTCVEKVWECLEEGSSCLQWGAWWENSFIDFWLGVNHTHPSIYRSRPICRVHVRWGNISWWIIEAYLPVWFWHSLTNWVMCRVWSFCIKPNNCGDTERCDTVDNDIDKFKGSCWRYNISRLENSIPANRDARAIRIAFLWAHFEHHQSVGYLFTGVCEIFFVFDKTEGVGAQNYVDFNIRYFSYLL